MRFHQVLSLFGAIALLLTTSLGVAEAGKTDWRDSQYDFSTIQTVWVDDIDLTKVGLNDIQEKSLQQYYHEQEKRPQWNVLNREQINRKISLLTWKDMDALTASDPEKAQELWTQNLGKVVNGYVTASLTRYEPSSYVIPAHTEWQSREEEDTYTDRDGKTQTVRRRYDVPVYVPDRTVWVGNVTVRFDLHDATDGRIIFSREDARSDEGDLKDIYELSVLLPRTEAQERLTLYPATKKAVRVCVQLFFCSEFNLGHFLRLFIRLEILPGLEAKHPGIYGFRQALDLGVIVLHRRIIIPAGYRNAVFRAGQLIRELTEAGIRLDRRIVLRDHEQVAQRSGELSAGLRCGIDALRTSELGPRIIDGLEYFLFLLGHPLRRRNEIWYEIAAPLQLIIDLAPFPVDILVGCDQRIIAAKQHDGHEGHRSQNSNHSF